MANPLTVGFVGLGNMGRCMAANLAARLHLADAAGTGALVGRKLLLHDIDPAAVTHTLSLAQDQSRGRPPAAPAKCLQELASNCRDGVVLLCLPGKEQVLEAAEVMAPDLGPGALVVDCSTSGPDAAREVSALLQAGPGAAFLDAPVTGAPARAATGTLTTMVGGPAEHLERARPLLQAFSSKVLHTGEAVGSGQLAKALNNCLYNVSVAAMAEVLPLAKKQGLALEPLLEVVSSGTGQSFGFDQWAERALRREFEAPRYGYPMGLAFKDFETLQGAAGLEGLPPVLAAACGTYRRALDMGLAGEHKGAMVKVFEERMQVKCGKGEE